MAHPTDLPNDVNTIFLWEDVNRRAKALHLRIVPNVHGWGVEAEKDFMGGSTASLGCKLTTGGITTVLGLSCFIAGIEAIVQREEMLRALIGPTKTVVISPHLPGVAPSSSRHIKPERAYDILQRIFNWLYLETDGEREWYDSDKEWDSAADFVEFVAQELAEAGMAPCSRPGISQWRPKIDEIVWWEDPDEGACSASRKVTAIKGDIYVLDDGTEATIEELQPYTTTHGEDRTS